MDGAAPSFLTKYLGPLRAVLDDPDVVEIAINPDGQVWLERQGAAHMVHFDNFRFMATDSINLATAIASHVGVPLSVQHPSVSGKVTYDNRPLRAQVMAAPVVESGCAITLRSYSRKRILIGEAALLHGKLIDLDSERLKRAKAITALAQNGDVKRAMQQCVDDRLNVMISGGTSTGKTTFARGLLDLVDPNERLVTIEDAFELFPQQQNCVSLKADRKANSEANPAKLLEGTLRLRPDRIILGELRGDESKTFLDAINTGHGGSFTTVHADTAKKAIDRLALMVMSVGMNMSFQEVRRYCASSIDVIIQLGRHEGRRGIAEIFQPASLFEQG